MFNLNIKDAERPVHPHDCDICKFLGTHSERKRKYDLYFCPQGNRPTVIARFGEYGDYLSGLVFSDEGALKVAAERAISKGLLSQRDWEIATKRG